MRGGVDSTRVRRVVSVLARRDANRLEELAGSGWALPEQWPKLRPHILRAIDDLSDQELADRLRQVMAQLNDAELWWLVSGNSKDVIPQKRRNPKR